MGLRLLSHHDLSRRGLIWPATLLICPGRLSCNEHHVWVGVRAVPGSDVDEGLEPRSRRGQGMTTGRGQRFFKEIQCSDALWALVFGARGSVMLKQVLDVMFFDFCD